MKTNRQVEGFAMIEVLLAVVILAIGLLAGSRMQILSLNYTQGATTRTHATMAANDIIDRMRLNPSALDAYDNFSTDGQIPADQDCDTAGCSALNLARQDLRDWASYFGKGDVALAQVSILLPPDAVGTITESNGVRNIRITWSDFVRGKEKIREILVSAVI